MEAAAATPALRRLEAFVGTWDTTGEMKDDASKPPVRFTATDTYEWLPGGHFLLHRFDADMPDGRVQGIEVIGYDEKSRSYPMHSFDNQGNANVMHARVENGTWTFTGETIRFTGGFRDGEREFGGLWEMRAGEGSAWQPWMEIRLRKVDRGSLHG